MFIPNWFINSLVNENLKQQALEGKLKGKSSVLVKCFKCNKEFSVIVNSCVKTRNKFDNEHKLCCRSCAKSKDDLYYGAKFGDLTVLEKDTENSNKIKCRCACGNIVSIFSTNLRTGKTTSCGKHKVQNICKTLFFECISLFEEFLKSINISYSKNIFNKELNSVVDFVVVYNKKEIYVKFYGEYTVRSNEPTPKNLFIKASCLNKRIINIFINEYINNYYKLNQVFKDIICEKQKINARCCVVKEVSKEIAISFFNENHIQGATLASSLNYGLFYENNLYAIMGFGNANYHSMKKSYCNDFFDSTRYELHRYAVKLNTVIIGGYAKLLAHFEREKSPSYLLSYSANDWFKGDMYEKMGFKLSGLTPPRYYWIKNHEVLNREKCQTKKLCEKYPNLYKEALETKASNKETFVMLKLGYTKVYSSGTKKWEKFYM